MNNQKQQTIAYNLMIGIALVIGFVAGARAETQHTQDHKAYQQMLLKQCGVDVTLTKKGYMMVSEAGVMTSAPLLEVTCPTQSGSVTITFLPPTQREDGSPLPCDEIASYRIVTDLNTARAWTIDTNGVESSQPTEHSR